MRSAHGKKLVMLYALVAMAVGSLAWAQTQSPPAPQTTGQTSPAQTPPKKKPSKPINPDETGGVRGPGSPLTVRVLLKGKTVENAHVTVKNSNGTLAGSCFTNASGNCKVDVGPDDYEIDAAGDGRTGTLKLHVSAETGIVSIKLLKTTTTPTTAKP